MKFWLTLIGTVVVAVTLAGSGAFAGQVCVAKSTCIAATRGGITFKAAK